MEKCVCVCACVRACVCVCLLQSCSECSEPTLAQSLCTLCNKWLCYQCTDVHQHQSPPAAQRPDLHQRAAPAAAQRPDLHQRACLLGPGSDPCSLLMCHSHRQEPLELFCESCDLLCCSSCQLSSHKNHRVVQISKALQDQRWLFDSLTAQVEEKRSAVESSAKQTEDRLRGVKIAHRKAENQIKMAKMIMMNELNKRANLLIEQLQKISEDVQQGLEDQLRGAIEICGQLDHIQEVITWATTHHSGDPVLFSRALISLQMQQLLEPALRPDSWSPIKIRFNWDASYWTKQISTLGQLTVEGGNCPYPQGVACSSILRPQPITCLALPSACHRAREPGCGFQASCCEPQMCCLHGIDPPSLDKSRLGATFCSSRCNSSCVRPASLHQNQQLQRCWDPSGSSQCLPSSSPVPVVGHIQLARSQGSTSQAQAAPPHPEMKSFLDHDQREVLPDSRAQPDTDHSRPARCQGKPSAAAAPQQELSLDRDVMTGEIWDDGCREEEVRGQTGSREPLGEEQQGGPVLPAAEQQRNSPEPTPGSQGDGRRPASLETSQTDLRRDSAEQKSRLSPGLVCTGRDRRSQSIPTDLAAPPAAASSDRPAGRPQSTEAGAANKCARPDPRQRRASDGVLCVATETSSYSSSRDHRPPLSSYKTEPDHLFTYANEEIGRNAEEGCSVSRDGRSSDADVREDSARVPVVCLQRLKILVSQVPPHGRRQNQPSPASGDGTPPQRRTAHHATPEEIVGGGCAAVTPPHPLPLPSCTESVKRRPSSTPPTASGFSHRGETSSPLATPPFSGPKYAPGNSSALDSDSDPRSAVEEDAGASWASSSEPELECSAAGNSMAALELGLDADADAARDSEESLEHEDPGSDAGAESEDAQGLDADAGTESDTRQDSNPGFQAETDPDIVSDQHPDSRDSVESELGVESEQDPASDDLRPLRSDLEEEPHVGPGERTQRCTEVQSDQSEDFCAVCLIGGDLLCCDRCPKVFHLSCHIPSLLSFPSGDWLCGLCRDVLQPEVEYDCENERRSGERGAPRGLPDCDQRKCERLTLLILSNVLSAPFQEPVSPLARHYYQIIKRPVDLSMIRANLSRRNVRRYESPEQFVSDVFLMFCNCAKFNYPDSEVAQAGRSLEAFFVSKLREVFPDRVFPAVEADSDSDEYDQAGFPWPDGKEQSDRKRKRRNSLKFRRHHV
ncbi:tripartite motif-containing protein 66 [Brachionichthys hirsutus]|uniref:tripartite motif-containing protein 66 n=1 Tax=Brachionichthys hirsutus TaxID=412623 RepID=UPI0036053DB5